MSNALRSIVGPIPVALRKRVVAFFPDASDDGPGDPQYVEVSSDIRGGYVWVILGEGIKYFISGDNGAGLKRALDAGAEDIGDHVAALYKVGFNGVFHRYGPRELYQHQLDAIVDSGIIHNG